MNKIKTISSSFLLLAIIGGISGAAFAQSGSTLAKVTARGQLKCGVNTDLPGFARSNSLGEYSGLDVDFCTAVAVAIFNDADAVEFLPTTSAERFESLVTKEFDVLARNTTWTFSRQALYGQFIGVNYYDGQGFMVRKRSGIRSALELDNKSICVGEGTTTTLNAIDYFAVNKMRFVPVEYPDTSLAFQGYADGDCIAFSTDRSALAAQRASLEQPDAHTILPEIISKEPLGPVVANDDDQWFKIVKWTLYCMINAEEMGVTSTNINEALLSSSPTIRRLLGVQDELGANLGLDKAWCGNIIRAVGNYGESYSRHLGVNTEIGLERGVNDLWTNGGLMFAPPIR